MEGRIPSHQDASSDPEQPKKKRQVSCYTCGCDGHMARDCEQTRCHYCGSRGHVAKQCTKGATNRPSDQFILCDALGGEAAGEGGQGRGRCCVRRFVVPLSRAKVDFDLEDLRDGRIDVGCRCVTGALFRSQGLRHNTEVRLCLGGGDERGAVVAVSGGLVRDLLPDEASMASRLRYVLRGAERGVVAGGDKCGLQGAGGGGEAEGEGSGGGRDKGEGPQPSGQKLRQMQVLDAKMRRGIRCFSGGSREALRDLVESSSSTTSSAAAQGGAGEEGGSEYLRGMVFLKLHPDGTPIDAFLRGMDPSRRVSEFVVVLGDDRGLRPEDEEALSEAAGMCGHGVEVHQVSLGGAMLLASHCIVLVQHYLDLHVHTCPSRLWESAGKLVAKRRKQTQNKRAKRG